MMKVNIGFCGKMGAGKTTGAGMLATELALLGINAEQRSFAAILKVAVRIAGEQELEETEKIERLKILFSSVTDTYSPDRLDVAIRMMAKAGTLYPNVANVKNRMLLQYIGHECGREHIAQDFWLHLADKPFDGVVIYDDVRYNNEARIMDELIYIDIASNMTLYTNRIHILGYSDTAATLHASENALNVSPTIIIPVGFTSKHIRELGYTLYDRYYSRTIRSRNVGHAKRSASLQNNG